MPQIIPIKNLKNTSDISDLCHETAEPIYITKNGYGDMVIMSMELYESYAKKLAAFHDWEISRMHTADKAVTETEKSRTTSRRITMKEMILKNSIVDGVNSLSAIDSHDNSIVYTLLKKEQSLLAEKYAIQSSSETIVANIKMEHVLFTPGKMPRLTLTTQDGEHFIVKREIEQLEEVIVIEGEDLTISGDLFSEHFELLHKNKCIATFTYHDSNKLIRIDSNYELISILFAFAIELAK